MRVDLVQQFTGDPCVGELRKRNTISTDLPDGQGHTHPEVVMSCGTTPIERTEPQVSLILGGIRTLHTLEEGSIQKHGVDRVFSHHYYN